MGPSLSSCSFFEKSILFNHILYFEQSVRMKFIIIDFNVYISMYTNGVFTPTRNFF